MRLLTKFNLVLIVFFGAGGLIIAQLAYSFLTQNAREQVLRQAELMMASARATRDYTSEQIKPLLLKNPEHETNFLPQTVPAFSAITIFNSMRKAYPNYAYREATLNPPNLVDRADDWETDIIRYFNDHPGDKKFVGERETPAEPLGRIKLPGERQADETALDGDGDGKGHEPGLVWNRHSAPPCALLRERQRVPAATPHCNELPLYLLGNIACS